MGRIIGVVSGKGGVGKTTVVANLGAALAGEFKRSVVAVDGNITTSHLGVTLGYSFLNKTINHVLRGEMLVEEAIHPHSSGMHVVPASLKLKDLKGIDFAYLKPALKQLVKTHDFVLLDAGPGLGREGVGALVASDELLYVAQPTLPSVMDVVRCQEAVKATGKPALGLVLNLMENHGHHLTKQNAENLSGLEVLTVIPKDDHVPQALAAQVAVVLAHPDAPASRQLRALAARIAGLPVKEEPKAGEQIARRFSGTLGALQSALGIE